MKNEYRETREDSEEPGLTSRNELSESSTVTPSDRSASRTELNPSQGRHIVTKDCFSELNSVGEDRNCHVSILVETIGIILRNDRSHMSI
jgi:hypothetical protein